MVDSCCNSKYSTSIYGVDNHSIRNVLLGGDCGGEYIAQWNVVKSIDCDAADGLVPKMGAMLTVVGHQVVSREFSKGGSGVSRNVPAIGSQIRINPGTVNINPLSGDSKQIEEIFNGQWGFLYLPKDEPICGDSNSVPNAYWWIKCTDCLFINSAPQLWNTAPVGTSAASGRTPFQSYQLEILPKFKSAKLTSFYDIGGGATSFSKTIDFSVLSRGILAPCAGEDGGPKISDFRAKGDLTHLCTNDNGTPLHTNFQVTSYETAACPPTAHDYMDCFQGGFPGG